MHFDFEYVAFRYRIVAITRLRNFDNPKILLQILRNNNKIEFRNESKHKFWHLNIKSELQSDYLIICKIVDVIFDTKKIYNWSIVACFCDWEIQR